jgi:hypothetical protein
VDDDELADGLLAWLGEQGYESTDQATAPGPFGNRRTALRRGTCQVTVYRDRGQWFVEAGPPGVDGFDMSLWEACLRDRQPRLEPAPFADEARLLRNVLHEIERTMVLDGEALPRLGALREWLQEARWSSAL